MLLGYFECWHSCRCCFGIYTIAGISIVSVASSRTIHCATLQNLLTIWINLGKLHINFQHHRRTSLKVPYPCPKESELLRLNEAHQHNVRWEIFLLFHVHQNARSRGCLILLKLFMFGIYSLLVINECTQNSSSFHTSSK